MPFCTSPKVRVTRLSLLEDHDVDPLPQLCTQQRLAQRQAALRRGDGGDQRTLEHDQLYDVRGRASRAHGSHHRIDDEGADVGH
jgi:hypothetical protein